MRMRYERRDPRPEDLRYIDELKSIVDGQERDICHLTEQLRELQLAHQQILQLHPQHQPPPQQNSRKNRNKNKNRFSRGDQQQQQQAQVQQQQLKKAPATARSPQRHKSNCNVIYEENENEVESSPEKCLDASPGGDDDDDDGPQSKARCIPGADHANSKLTTVAVNEELDLD